mmetsp:Transcript_7522/g.12079  ORF Transcript_7522/g.12079 Transcript_7522/m.12079 type:complete len:144 (+) Transcript_7522:152-583(+)
MVRRRWYDDRKRASIRRGILNVLLDGGEYTKAEYEERPSDAYRNSRHLAATHDVGTTRGRATSLDAAANRSTKQNKPGDTNENSAYQDFGTCVFHRVIIWYELAMFVPTLMVFELTTMIDAIHRVPIVESERTPSPRKGRRFP